MTKATFELFCKLILDVASGADGALFRLQITCGFRVAASKFEVYKMMFLSNQHCNAFIFCKLIRSATALMTWATLDLMIKMVVDMIINYNHVWRVHIF